MPTFFNPQRDLVITHNPKTNEFIGGGYAINSALLNRGLPAMVGGAFTEQAKADATQFSHLFTDLIVPAGLFMMTLPVVKNITGACNAKANANEKSSGDSENENEGEETSVVPEDLYDKLLKLVEPGRRAVYNIKSKRRLPVVSASTIKRTRRAKKHH